MAKAEAVSDLSRKDELEQKILQVLKEAGSPVRTTQLVMKCKVPKKELNQTLYRMKSQSRVVLLEPATWGLRGAGAGELVSEESGEAQGCVQQCLQDTASTPQTPGPPAAQIQEGIYKLLAAKGPWSALAIAQALGMKTAKDVNPALYAMRNRHQLSLDENTRLWAVNLPEGCRRRTQTTENIYQQNTVNMIFQNGPNSCISIKKSKGIHIGLVNITEEDTTSGDSSKSFAPRKGDLEGSAAPLQPPPSVPDDPSMQEAPAGAWNPPNITMWKCSLVQMGNNNKQSVHGPLEESPESTPPESPSDAESAPSGNGQSAPGICQMFTSKMAALTLEKVHPTPAEDGVPGQGNELVGSRGAGADS